ncbi:MAG TPA: ABC transporter permease [Mycobacteriales bacterium]|nr:ABC transporter permease [Mycobacteriales bacterium]
MSPDLLATHVNNSTWHQITTWFTSRSSWFGSDGSAGVFRLLYQHVWISALSLAITCAIGIPLATLLARWRRGGLVVTSIANSARSIPVVGVMLLLAVGPIGIGTEPAVIALVIFALPPIVTNTYTGIREVDAETTRAAVGMGMTRMQVLRQVELPLAIPLIATGIRLAAVQLWATATIAAIVGSGGLGQLITVGYATQYYGEVYGGVMIIAVTAIGLDASLQGLQSLVRRRYGAALPVQA